MLSGRVPVGTRPFRYHASWGNVGGITRTAASVELDILSEAELVRVRDYERRNKNRETLLEQIERCACRVHVQRQPL